MICNFIIMKKNKIKILIKNYQFKFHINVLEKITKLKNMNINSIKKNE